MYILDIIKLLFTKIGDKETVKKYLDYLVKIPKGLKQLLIIVLTIGIIYYGFSKIYTYELNIIKQDLQNIKIKLSTSINENDMFYLMEAIKTTESLAKYINEQEQLQLQLIKRHVNKHYPGDAIIYDIEAMEKRNEEYFGYYDTEFYKILNKCKNKYLETGFSDSINVNK